MLLSNRDWCLEQENTVFSNTPDKLMEFKKILYVTGPEPTNFAELESLMTFKKLGLEEFVYLIPGEAGELERKLGDYGIKTKILAEKTVSITGILNIASKEAVSLIVANLTKRRRDLIRLSPLPLLLLPKNDRIIEPDQKEIFEHVIFATDWSPVSKKAIQSLIHFKEIIGELEIVNVINRKLSIRDMINLRKMLVKTRNEFLDQGIDAEAHIYAGRRAEEITLAAKDYGGSSIVMGSKQKSPIKSIFYRNCPYEVAKRADIPLLIIPYLKGD